ncbi:MAG TPA: hypothetical protein PKE16_10125 [Hyphomicrobium sp.]|nr:hypothetical protein [Hyphomicrobium sp.]
MSEDTWSQTYSGCVFDYADMEHNVFDLEDIAHHLALTNRYGGATFWPYSVAQHSAALAHLIFERHDDPEWALYALFHDAAEAYTHDIRRPLKGMLPEYQRIEARVLRALLNSMRAQGFPIPVKEPPRMKEYDTRITLDEKDYLMRPCERRWSVEDRKPLQADVSLFVKMPFEVAKSLWLASVTRYSEIVRARRELGLNVVRPAFGQR